MSLMRRLVPAVALILLVGGELSALVPAARRTAPVSVAGAPRSLVSFVVPLPIDLEVEQAVVYRVERTGMAEVLGRTEGVLSGLGRRTLPLTVRVPANAQVGLLDVADVYFMLADGREYVVPIVLRVPAVRAVQLIAPPPLRELRGGDRVELSFRVENRGNTHERVQLALEPPQGWAVRSGERTVVTVAPFATTDVTVRLLVPASASAGDVQVIGRLRELVSRDSANLMSARVILNVRESEVQGPRMQVVSYVAAASSPQGSGALAGFTLAGPLLDNMGFNVSVQPRQLMGREIGFGNVGVQAQPIQALVYGKNWRANSGIAALQMPVLTGAQVFGEGVDLSFTRGRTTMQAIAARPVGAGTDGGLYGAKVAFDAPVGRIDVSASQLFERRLGADPRELSAVGADWSRDFGSDVTVGGGLAMRSFANEARLGTQLSFEQRNDRGSVRASVVHAPGGQDAFGQGAGQLQFSLDRTISDRLVVDASLNGTQDRTVTLGQSRFHTLGVGSRYRLTEKSALRGRVLMDGQTVTPDADRFGAFGSAQYTLEGGGDLLVAGWSLSATSRLGAAERRNELAEGRWDVVRVLQRGFSLSSSRAFDGIGSVSAQLNRTLTAAGAGIPGLMDDATLQFGSVPMQLGSVSLDLSSRATYLRSSTLKPLVLTGISGGMRLAQGTEVRFAVDYNPMLRTAAGGAPVTMSLRVSTPTSVGVPRSLTKVGGIVFNDRNGNGQRDQGEPGISGVTLFIGGTRVISEESGAYRVPSNARGVPRVDASSLPRGYVVAPQARARQTERGDVPLRETGSLILRLSLAPGAEGRLPQVDLNKVSVWIRDEYGTEWVGRHYLADEIHFENVPVGRYSFRLDASEAGEPVRLEEGVLAEVAPGVERGVTVTLRGRDLRIITPSERSNGTRGGRGGAGGAGGSGGSGGSGRIGGRTGGAQQ